MQTSAKRRLTLRSAVIALGFAVASFPAFTAPVRADADDWRRGERHEWRENRWREHERHEWRERHEGWNYGWGYVEPPPPVVYGPSPGFNFDVHIR